MQQPERVSTSRVPALDGVRGLAILWVLSHQLSLPLPPHGWEAQVTMPLAAGWIGVQLFFVLSGFLITGILLDTRQDPQQLKHFYVRRALRILPLYVGVLGLGTLLVSFWPWPLPGGMTLADEWALQPWLWTFTSNWTAYLDHATAMFAHFWSLAVEEQFYLLWPLLIRQRTPQAVFKVGLLLAVASLVFRLAFHQLAQPSYASFMALYAFTPSRFDALALGAMAAAALRSPTLLATWQRHRRAIAWINVIALVLGARLTWGYAVDNPRTQLLGYSLLAWSFGCWILSLAVPASSKPVWWRSWLTWGWLRKVGEVSFGMYVLHLPLHNLGVRTLLERAGLSAPYSLAFSLAYLLGMTWLLYGLARLSFTWFESPLLRLKDRWAAYAMSVQVS